MKNPLDRFHYEFRKYLSEHATEDMSEEDMNELLQEFTMLYNNNIDNGQYDDGDDEMDAFDYVEEMNERWESGDPFGAYESAEKALELDPDCIDAIAILATKGCRSMEEVAKGLEGAIAKSTEIMRKQGYLDDDIGHFWGIWETRPYMRLLNNYADSLIRLNRYNDAAKVYERLLELNPSDNQGIRYSLFPIYVYQNVPVTKLLNIMGDYEEENTSLFVLPLALYHYRIGDKQTAKDWLHHLWESNDDTLTFLKAITTGKLGHYKNNMNQQMGYRPNTIDELIVAVDGSRFLYNETPEFFKWAKSVVKEF